MGQNSRDLRECELPIDTGVPIYVAFAKGRTYCGNRNGEKMCDVCNNLADPDRTTEDARADLRKIKDSEPNII